MATSGRLGAGRLAPMSDRPIPNVPEISKLMPLAGLLGVEAVAASLDQVHLRLPWSAGVCTAGGIMHGGAVMALADTAGALLAFLNLPPGSPGTTTTDSHTRFLGAVRDGRADAVARLLHRGRTIIAVDTEVRDAGGRLVARTTQAQLVLAPRGGPRRG
jgi:1,4-dihydroxy-2-naphthoyl-CoA hydrolase